LDGKTKQEKKMKNNQENKQAFVLGFQSEILQSHAT
jgi:hypothetical protein